MTSPPDPLSPAFGGMERGIKGSGKAKWRKGVKALAFYPPPKAGRDELTPFGFRASGFWGNVLCQNRVLTPR